MRILLLEALSAGVVFSATTVTTVDYFSRSQARITFTSSASFAATLERVDISPSTDADCSTSGRRYTNYVDATSYGSLVISGLAPSTEYKVCGRVSEDGGNTWSVVTGGAQTTFTTSAAPAGNIPVLPTEILTFSVSPPTVTGTTRVVGATCTSAGTVYAGCTTYTTIALAVAAAVPGDQIILPAGAANKITTGYVEFPFPPANTGSAILTVASGDVNTTTDEITLTGVGGNLVNGDDVRWLGGEGNLTLPMGKALYVIDKADAADEVVKLSLTPGGLAINITATGAGYGRNVLAKWSSLQALSYITVRTSTPDAQLPPEGVRLNPTNYSEKLATVECSEYASGYGCFFMRAPATHWYFRGLQIQPQSKTTSGASPNPLTNMGLIYQSYGASYIVWDQIYFHLLPFPDRNVAVFGTNGFNGSYVAIQNSYTDNRFIWHPWVETSTLVKTNSTTITITAGTFHLGHADCSIPASTATITSSSAGNAVFYMESNCAMKLVLPTGATATFANGTVTNAATPDFPAEANGSGRFGVWPMGKISLGTNVWNTFATTGYGDQKMVTGVWLGRFYDIAGAVGIDEVAEGGQDTMPYGPGPLMIQNNYWEAGGINWHWDGSNGTTELIPRDTLFRRNYITNLGLATLHGSQGTSLRFYGYRHLLEGKALIGGKVTGNIFNGGFADLNLGTQVGFYNNVVGTWPSPIGTTITDVVISHNTFQNGAGGLQINASVPGTIYQTPQPAQRFLVENNLFQNLDGFQYFAPSRTEGVGWMMALGLGLEDVTVKNNTAWNLKGSAGTAITLYQSPMSGFSFTGNLVDINTSNLGIQADVTAGEAPRCNLEATAEAKLNCFVNTGFTNGTSYSTPGPYTFTNNVFVPRYSISSGTALVGNTTQATLEAAWPNHVAAGRLRVPAGATVAIRELVPKFFQLNVASFSATDNNYRMRYDSPYFGSVGVDMDRLESEQGKVSNARVISITSTTAQIGFYSPDSFACTVEYGTSATWGTGTRVSDGGGARVRVVNISGLTTATAYNVRINCAVEQPQLTFTTQ